MKVAQRLHYATERATLDFAILATGTATLYHALAALASVPWLQLTFRVCICMC